MAQANIRGFFDEPTFTITYLVSDPATKKAAIIDPSWIMSPAAASLTPVRLTRSWTSLELKG